MKLLLLPVALALAAMPLKAGEWYSGMNPGSAPEGVPEPSPARAQAEAEPQDDVGGEEPQDVKIYSKEELRDMFRAFSSRGGGEDLGREVLQAAAAYLGTPYGTGHGHMDCSLFVKTALVDAGAADGSFPRTAAEQYRAAEQGRAGLRLLRKGEAPRPGDLIFFRNTVHAHKYKGITHVGLYTGPKFGAAGTDIMHASSSNGVVAARVTGMKIAGFARLKAAEKD